MMSTTDQHSKPPRSPVFSLFQQLPLELRIQIWEHALIDATVGRIIKVAVYHQNYVTMHCCWTTSGRFCGKHGSCSASRSGLPSLASYCMTDGYFAVTDRYPTPETSESASGMFNLSLACREARRVVVQRYPKLLRIYRDQWFPGIESRLVRCCPAIDVLLIYAVPDFSIGEPNENIPYSEYFTQLRQNYLNHIFPRDKNLFIAFRDVVSSFQHLAFYYRGYPNEFTSEDDSEDESRLEANNKFANLRHLTNNKDFQALLLYFVSLKQLVAWPDPQYWPEIRENAVVVGDVNDIQFPGSRALGRVYYLIQELRDVMSDYNERVEIHNNHFAESDKHWAVRAKPLERVGCYAASSWLAGHVN